MTDIISTTSPDQTNFSTISSAADMTSLPLSCFYFTLLSVTCLLKLLRFWPFPIQIQFSFQKSIRSYWARLFNWRSVVLLLTFGAGQVNLKISAVSRSWKQACYSRVLAWFISRAGRWCARVRRWLGRKDRQEVRLVSCEASLEYRLIYSKVRNN